MRILFLILIICLVSAGSLLAVHPLEEVEADQTGELRSSSSIFNKNIALNSRNQLTHVSSYGGAAFGKNAHDGNIKTSWNLPQNVKEGFIEISWGLNKTIDKIDIYTYRDLIEKYTLEIFDGEWKVISEGGKLGKLKELKFSPRPASALRLKIVTAGNGGGIKEIEVYNTASVVSNSVSGSVELIEAMKTTSAVVLFRGSRYGYSRQGRELAQPRLLNFEVSDRHIEDTVQFICSKLGGKIDTSDKKPVMIKLNGITENFELKPRESLSSHLKALAKNHKLELHDDGSLIVLGKSIKPLTEGGLAEGLRNMLGKNPALVDWEENFKSPDVIITPTSEKIGKAFEWTGLRCNIVPGTNNAAWLKYMNIKSIRSWVNCVRYMRRWITPVKLKSLKEMETLMAGIRENPEESSLIDWKSFKKKYQEELDAEFSIYKKLGITVINCTGPKNWEDNLEDDFISWVSTYATTYYLAKHFDVAAHQFGNEPDWYLDKLSDEKIAFRLMLIGDAVHSAIEDVNRLYKKNLKPIYAAPVLASKSYPRICAIMMKNIRTRFNGEKSDKDIVQLFNRHRYGGRPYQNVLEVNKVKKIMMDSASRAIPQVFTEINYSTDKYWRSPSSQFTSDSPSVFVSMGSMWGAMTQNQGVHGIFLFKFNSNVFKSFGAFSNTVSFTCPLETDSSEKAEDGITYNTKNSEVIRLFAKGFRDSRPIFKTDTVSSDIHYKAYTSYDKEKDCYYIWSVQINEYDDYNLEFDLSKLNIPAGVTVTAEAVSEAGHGEVVASIVVPNTKKIRLRQPAESVMLLTIPRKSLRDSVILPQSDATVAQGEQADNNFGDEKWLQVRRNSNNSHNRISYLKFDLPAEVKKIKHAHLELHGKSENSLCDKGFMIRVYSLRKENWQENQISGSNAPNLYRNVSSIKDVNYENYPLGHVTCFNTSGKLSTVVTNYIKEALKRGDKQVSFVLIRERHWTDENTNTAYGRLYSKEAGSAKAPKLKLFYE